MPWKNCKNIIDYYKLCLNQQSDTGEPNSRQSADQTSSIEDERKKCTELRNKLDARSADGKDAKLKQCSVDISNIILDLIRANSGQHQALRESNRKSQQIVENRDNDDGSPNGGSFSSFSSSLPSSQPAKGLSPRTSRSSAKTNSTCDDKTSGSTKEQSTEKRTSKSFKSIVDKKTSPRTASKSNQSQTSQTAAGDEQRVKTEPKDQYEFDDQLETECLGSLKFYKDGQLVLKLKAKQPMDNNKCQWEESADSAELSKLSGCKKKRVESHKAREPLEQNNKKNADENQGDDSPFESEDSRGSSEFSLQKPLTMNGLFKKAKVRVENNYVPLPPLNSLTKDDESDLESGNRKSISPNDSKLNSDDLKRKMRTPKSGAKKSKVPKLNAHLNECTNKLNISPDLIQQQLDSFTTAPSSNPLVDQLTFLSSLPLDVRQKLISDSLLNNNRLNELNGLHSLNSLMNSSAPNADNAFLENIDKIKMQNQIECLMSNLNALIEADQLK